MTQREAVYSLCQGKCAGCGRLQRLRDRRGWHVHHVIKQQTLTRRRAPSRYIRGAVAAVVVCQPCHFNHEARSAVIPLERLPVAVIAAVDELGAWASDLLRRYHPPMEVQQ